MSDEPGADQRAEETPAKFNVTAVHRVFNVGDEFMVARALEVTLAVIALIVDHAGLI